MWGSDQEKAPKKASIVAQKEENPNGSLSRTEKQEFEAQGPTISMLLDQVLALKTKV